MNIKKKLANYIIIIKINKNKCMLHLMCHIFLIAFYVSRLNEGGIIWKQ
jgi:hypothetical protein